MITTLLYSESPLIGIPLTVAPLITYYYGYPIVTIVLLIILLFFLFFYRHYPLSKDIDDHQIICPCDGEITQIIKTADTTHISIFLSPFNIHTQVYPVNGTVISRIYDETGKFDIVVDAEKSKENEKKIHSIRMKNEAIIQVTQIAGFLPRRITSSELVPEEVKAGQYLGMIKFGSRVDLLIPNKSRALVSSIATSTKASAGMSVLKLDANIAIGNRITVGDSVGYYV
jgi:phosphatidylserine decarboxylase